MLRCKCGSEKIAETSSMYVEDFINVRFKCYDCMGVLSVDYKIESRTYFSKDKEYIVTDYARRDEL